MTPATHQRLGELRSVSDPADRARQALAAMEDARQLMEALAELRARAVFELYETHGASVAARLLGISRVNLYRVIGQVPEVRQRRAETAATVAALALTAFAGEPSTHNSALTRRELPK